MRISRVLIPGLLFLLTLGCSGVKEDKAQKIRVIFDTDANNELDDQHAMAYLFFNAPTFDLAGVTVNATRGGGNVENHYQEAERVMKLCGFKTNLPLYLGADSDFGTIKHQLDSSSFDGQPAVDFIIQEAHREARQKLIVLAVGKLTNLALALMKDPSISEKLKIVWLGSNYPEPGEYNLENDTAAVNYVLQTSVEFEMVTVRYGTPTGSAHVSVTQQEVNQRMPGRGPSLETPVTGRHGGTFSTFGDYSVNLFQHINYSGTPPSRALYDMVAVAIVKQPSWGEPTEVNRPILKDGQWLTPSAVTGKIIVWGNFDKEKILEDYYASMEHYQLVASTK